LRRHKRRLAQPRIGGPDQFQQSEYYLSYFRSVVGGDELQFMVNVDGAVLGLSLGRSTRFSLEEQGRLLCVRDWVLAAMRRHLQLLPPEGPVVEAVAGDLATLLDRFDARLTVREIETARLILQGFSSKAIAQQMGISPETVKVHRRNLYHKLNVNGHGELFALVLNGRVESRSKDRSLRAAPTGASAGSDLLLLGFQ
jgi:DNA-binding CsgD family transcriptional regulator